MTFPIAFLVIEALILLAFQRAGKLDFKFVPVLLVSFFFQLILIRFSSVIDYSPDIFGHLDYLYRIATSFALPDPKGWQYQQPALYYYYLAVCFKLLEWFDLYDPISPLRYFSHLLYVIYCVYVVRIVTAQKDLSTPLQWLCILFLLFWPSIQFTAIRLNTDTGFFLFYAMTFFYVQRWMREANRDDLLRAVLYASLSLLCKGTGILSFATIGLAWLFAWKYGNQFKPLFARPLRPVLLAGLVVLTTFSVYFGRVALYNYTHEASTKYFANLEDDYGKQPVSLGYYLSFDLEQYGNDVGFIAWNERPFLNSFLTAQLYNYFLEVPRPWVGYVLSYGYLMIFVLGLAGTFLCRPESDRGTWVSVAGVLCLMGGVILQRSMTLDGHMASGRYVYPVLILIIIGYARLMHYLQQKNMKPLAALLGLNAGAFILVATYNWYRFYL